MKPHERILELKQLKELANNFIEYYKPKLQTKNKEWRTDRLILNLFELKDIVRMINKNLHSSKVEEYCNIVQSRLEKEYDTEDLNDVTNPVWILNGKYGEQTIRNDAYGFNILRRIARLAPSHSLHHDIFWLQVGSEYELIEIAVGTKEPTILGKYLPESIDIALERGIAFYSVSYFNETNADILKSALDHSKEEKYILSNILLITLIESTVRSLLKYVYTKQNPNLSSKEINDYIYYKFTSLEQIIKKGDWKSDFQININDSITYYYDSTEPELEDIRKRWRDIYKNDKVSKEKLLDGANEIYEAINKRMKGEPVNINELQEKYERIANEIRIDTNNILNNQIAYVSVKVVLGFLNRKYKDDRNQIIHGNYFSFNHSWENMYYI